MFPLFLVPMLGPPHPHRPPNLTQGYLLDLTNALPRDPHVVPHLLECVRTLLRYIQGTGVLHLPDLHSRKRPFYIGLLRMLGLRISFGGVYGKMMATHRPRAGAQPTNTLGPSFRTKGVQNLRDLLLLALCILVFLLLFPRSRI